MAGRSLSTIGDLNMKAAALADAILRDREQRRDVAEPRLGLGVRDPAVPIPMPGIITK
jgi:hypothetical protein